MKRSLPTSPSRTWECVPAASAENCYRLFFFSSRRRHTRYIGDWSSDVCSSDLSRLAVALVVFLASQVAIAAPPKLPNVEPRDVGMDAKRLAEIDKLVEEGIAKGNMRSEERRVGKECRCGWRAWHEKKKKGRRDK